MATQAPGSLDFETLRQAIEDRDAETLIDFYADDAEIRTVNKNSTPSSPQVLRGKEEIFAYLRDVCGREMTHRVESEEQHALFVPRRSGRSFKHVVALSVPVERRVRRDVVGIVIAWRRVEDHAASEQRFVRNLELRAVVLGRAGPVDVVTKQEGEIEDDVALEAFSVIRDAMVATKHVGIARLVLYRRERAVMLRINRLAAP